MEATLGGDRLGSGSGMKQEMHNYGMNSFNLEQDFKSSLAPGVLYPFLKGVGTSHGTFDVNLDSFVRTLPTRGPLFGSFKLQLDLFSVPFRLYNGILHNNPVELGMNMNKVYLPKMIIRLKDGKNVPRVAGSNDDNYQINDCALMKYLGISGIGKLDKTQETAQWINRKLQCVPMLGYYDIFKCYYSNKQEENAYVITHGTPTYQQQNLQNVSAEWDNGEATADGIKVIRDSDHDENHFRINTRFQSTNQELTSITVTGNHLDINNLVIWAWNGDSDVWHGTWQDWQEEDEANNYHTIWQKGRFTENIMEFGVNVPVMEADAFGMSVTHLVFIFKDTEQNINADIQLTPFNLKNIDKMRNALLSANELGQEFVISTDMSANWNRASGEDNTGLPYIANVEYTEGGISWNAFKMNGLCVKTYQSDLFNNWLDTEFIDGENGISAITKVDTTEGGFTMDTLVLAEKIYNLLNRILVKGGTYQDWQEAVYGEGIDKTCETPMYIGGMSAEIMFEEVISNAETNVAGDFQPLGSLGGKGTQVGKKGGENIHVKLGEPGYIIGIASLTPRISYSQGNDWDMTELDTIDDLHKPELDGIGFQDLMIEQMAWWNTEIYKEGDHNGAIKKRESAGKQTAWINYQTAVDKCYGDFAATDGYAFMVLNRNYEHDENDSTKVKDITTYIDPSKYNYAFAYDKLDAQNFWAQFHSKVVARRKMGAQQIPNL